VARVADALVVTASVGNLVEAVEHKTKRWVVGVQWHPERTNLDRNLDKGASEALLAEFVRQAVNHSDR
jgi:gamma-glutamyl-gamma-aminobutyrate hydrolase PuuD